MQKFLQYVRLTRPLNLFIIALTMALMRYFVIRPMVEVNGFDLQFPTFYFALLVLSTVLIAAAGNIINDYFDQRADRVNKPKDIIVGVHVKRRVAMALHQIFNLAGLTLAFFVAYQVGIWKLSIISFFAAGSLWFYSVQFKKEFIVGNIIIAVLAGLVPLLVGVYEIPLLIKAYGAEVVKAYAESLPGKDPSAYFKVMFYFIIGYSVFAFLLNLIREIQKDMADVKGDNRIYAHTIPLVIGIRKAKWISAALTIMAIGALVLVQQKFVSDIISLIYLTIAVILPLVISLWVNQKAIKRNQFLRAGNFLKLAMLGGILYSIVHYYIYYASGFA